jgi:hypothetical protein
MKHQLAVLFAKLIDHLRGLIRDLNSRDLVHKTSPANNANERE